MEQNQNFENLPSLEEINEIISEIKNADFSKLGYNKLINKIKSLIFIPFVTAKLNKGYHIERGRINEINEIFSSEKDLSYRTDYNNITKYGRANIPNTSLFYGAIESDVIKHPRLINLLETSEIFRNLEHAIEDADFIMTVGKWEIIQEFEIVEVVFDENSIKNSEEVRKSYEFHYDKMKKELPNYVEQFELILKFFSNQFAKKEIITNFDYMVSAAYSNLAIEWENHKGIKYPSVKTDYQGHNIVLSPFAVENYLKLVIAAMFKVEKRGKETTVIPIKLCTEFGHMNTNFKWVDIEPIKYDL